MTNRRGSSIEQFFRDFETHSNSGDIAASVAQFADVFMAASPGGAQAVRASDFARVLPRRKQFFDSLGCRSTELVSLHQTLLNDRFTMAETQWRMTFACNDGQQRIALADSVFILDTGVNPFRIVFYLSKLDPAEMLRRHGIIAA